MLMVVLGRHPDVVHGIIAPLPTLSRQPRAMMRMMNSSNFGPPDPAFRQQKIQQHYGQQQQSTDMQGQLKPALSELSEPAYDGELPAVENEKPVLPASVPPKPANAPLPALLRSLSHPEVQHPHINGVSARSDSPALSNVSFHGNNHPRRVQGWSPYNNGIGNGGSKGDRSSSTGTMGKKSDIQRIPGADDFPALGGSIPMQGDKRDSPIANGKTAAQVLSLPAPPRAGDIPPIPADGNVSNDHPVSPICPHPAGLQPDTYRQSHSIESDLNSHADLDYQQPSSVSVPAFTASPPTSSTRSQRGSISFTTAAMSAPPIESAPVSVKA